MFTEALMHLNLSDQPEPINVNLGVMRETSSILFLVIRPYQQAAVEVT